MDIACAYRGKVRHIAVLILGMVLLARLNCRDILDSTSPPTHQISEALGPQLVPATASPYLMSMLFRILKSRCEALQQTLREVRTSGRK